MVKQVAFTWRRRKRMNESGKVRRERSINIEFGVIEEVDVIRREGSGLVLGKVLRKL